MWFRRLAIASVVALSAVILFFGAWIILEAVFSPTTRYCPLGHKIDDYSHCVVITARDSRVLIRHSVTDRWLMYLEVREGAEITYYHDEPLGTKGVRVGFGTNLAIGKPTSVEIDGKKYKLREIQGPLPW